MQSGRLQYRPGLARCPRQAIRPGGQRTAHIGPVRRHEQDVFVLAYAPRRGSAVQEALKLHLVSSNQAGAVFKNIASAALHAMTPNYRSLRRVF
ncbi:hypothetical protein D3C72_1865950 [compost metagenome]